MNRDNLNLKATELWLKLGRLINEKFGFENHLIDGVSLQNAINNPSDQQINEFISYVENQIAMLNEIE